MSNKEEYLLGASNIYGTNEVINLVNPRDFLLWIKRSNLFRKKNIFYGYRFFIETALRALADAIVSHTSIDLEEDYTFFRARHKGIELSKIPNSCEKIVFLKNFYIYIKKIRKSKNYKEIEAVYVEINKDIVHSVNDLILRETNIDDVRLSRGELKKASTAYWTLIYFNQITHQVPQGYFVSCFNNNFNSKEYDRLLTGYSYTLEYVWENILGDEYKKYNLSQMHDSTSWDYPFDFFGKNDKKKNKDTSLDRYFGVINKDIVGPLQKKYKFNIFGSDLIHFKKNVGNRYFSSLLHEVQEPNLSDEELFEATTLWYNFEVLSSRTHIFNGVSTFLPLLVGIVERKLTQGIEEKSQVIRFKHYDKDVKGNDFSYGLLIQSYGTFTSDWSGWMIFDDCCGDYSGFSGQEYYYAEDQIKHYLDLGLIEVKEISISRKNFENYISRRITTRDIHQESQELKRINELFADSRGRLFELFCYYYASKHGNYSNLDWQVNSGKGEIDLILEEHGERRLVECKLDSSTCDLNKEIKKLKDKAEVIGASNFEFWFWHQVSPHNKKKLLNQKISYKILPELLSKNPNFNKNLDVIRDIFGKSLF